jgi:hypothetical protein
MGFVWMIRDLFVGRWSAGVKQFFLAAVAQNIKRLVRFLSQPTTPVLPATT